MSLVRHLQQQQQQQQQQRQLQPQGDLSRVVENGWINTGASRSLRTEEYSENLNLAYPFAAPVQETVQASKSSYISPGSSWVLLGSNNSNSNTSSNSSGSGNFYSKPCYNSFGLGTLGYNNTTNNHLYNLQAPAMNPPGSSFLEPHNGSLQQQVLMPYTFPGLGGLGFYPEQDHQQERLIQKREMLAAAQAEYGMRIGLDLGGRTYFSTAEDMVAVRLSNLAKRGRANYSTLPAPMCQAQGCRADLSTAKHYHRRHKVCEMHSKASTVTAANGQTQRFCQQCSRFHALSEFDEGKRSCRKRLADHNRRRRKPQPSSSSSAVGEDQASGARDHGTDSVDDNSSGERKSPTSSSNSHGSVKAQERTETDPPPPS